jgi:hypothetical protein
MATAFLPGALTALLLLSGAPLSLPPLPEDPVLAKVAPVQCVWYMQLAGVDKANPASKNRVEQLLAEDDVQNFLRSLSSTMKAAFAAGAAQGSGAGPNGPLTKELAEELPKLAEMVLTRPTVAYISDVSAGAKGPTIRGGLAMNVGDAAEATKSALEKIEKLIPPPGAAETASVSAEGWHTLPTPPDAPSVQWGVKDQYLVIGVGEGEAQLLWARTSKSPPEWLTDFRRRLAVDRPAVIQYVNVQTLSGLAEMALAANQGAERTRSILETLGFKNVKSFASVSGLDDVGLVNRTLVATEGPPAGLLSLLAGEPLTTDALDPIPGDASFAVAARLDANKALQTFMNIADLFDPHAREGIEGGLGQISQLIGVDIKAELIGSLGDTWCVYNSPGDGGLVFTGLTITATIRDRQKLLHANDSLVNFSKRIVQQSQQMRAVNGQRLPNSSLNEIEFHGQKIFFINFIGAQSPFAPAWCITDKQVVFALFPQTIKAYLSRQEAAGKAASGAEHQVTSLAGVPQVAQYFAVEPGPTVLSYQDTQSTFKLVYPFIEIIANVAGSQLQQQGIDLTIASLPNARAILPHLAPTVSTVQATKDGLRFETHGTLATGIGTLPMLMVPTLLPAVSSARQAARRAQSSNNLKQISLAMLNFVSAKKTFPPAFKADSDGKPLLSWRVMILPFIEQQNLFQQFHLDEPWDSENNKKLIEKMPDIFKAPGSQAAAEFKTVYLTARGDDTPFPGAKGIRLREITDGTSKTIMVVEASDDKAVVWTTPDDLEVDEKNPIAGLVGLRPGGFLAAFCDGSVKLIPQNIDSETLNLLFLRNSGKLKDVP